MSTWTAGALLDRRGATICRCSVEQVGAERVGDPVIEYRRGGPGSSRVVGVGEHPEGAQSPKGAAGGVVGVLAAELDQAATTTATPEELTAAGLGAPLSDAGAGNPSRCPQLGQGFVTQGGGQQLWPRDPAAS